MKIGPFDSDRQVLVIAEVGNNHEGSFGVAEELVGRAAEAGAQAIKFQTFRTELFVSPVQAERFRRMKGFELSEDQFTRLSQQARRAGLAFISTPLDLPSAEFLDGIVDAFKIASGDNTFYPLIETIAAKGKPTILSTGLADMAQIDHARTLLRRVWRDRGMTPQLALLHCVTAYPVSPVHANLAAIHTLAHAFDDTIGYSDHTIGTQACVLAVAAGSRIVEKHFTLANDYSAFRDHQLSADPPTLTRMIREIREVEAMMGSGAKVPQPEEAESMTAIRRSIAAARALPAGTVIGPGDIAWLRPGDGFPPGEERHVLGRRLAADLAPGAIIRPEHLA